MFDVAEMDRAYMNAAFIADGANYPAKWTSEAARFRAQMGARARLDQRFGSGEAALFDLFLPDQAPNGLLVFLHGGYWMAFGRQDWSHLAAGAVQRGWACALLGYPLAPQARLAEMTQHIAAGLAHLRGLGLGPIVVTGHSAGGHLAARMATLDCGVRRVVPISPLSDLRPLRLTQMNATLQIDAAEAQSESPALLARRPEVDCHVWVGGQERPAFLWQARTLSENWNCPWTVAPGRHHFDVIDDLAQPNSDLVEICLGGL